MGQVAKPGRSRHTGVDEHITHASGRMVTVCTTAVLAAFGIRDRIRYCDSHKDVKRHLRKHGFAVRSRMSACGLLRDRRGYYAVVSVGQIRERIRKLNAPATARFYVGVRGHAMLLDNTGRTIVDTAPRRRDCRRVLHISLVDQPHNLSD